MNRVTRIGLLFLAAIWIDQSVLPQFLPGGISLRLTAVLIAGLAIQRGPVVGAASGFLTGIVLSLLTCEPLGIASLALVAVGWGGGKAAERFPLSALPARIALVLGLLALEAATTFVSAWAFFGIAYRFNLLEMWAAALTSPAVLRVAGRPGRAGGGASHRDRVRTQGGIHPRRRHAADSVVLQALSAG